MKILVLKIFDIQLNEWLTFEYTSFGNQLKFTNMYKDMLPLRTDNFPPYLNTLTEKCCVIISYVILWYAYQGHRWIACKVLPTLYEKCACE